MDFDEQALQTVRETRLLIDGYDAWLFDEFEPYLGERLIEIGCGLGNILIGAHFFLGYTAIGTVLAILGILLCVAVFSLGFLFLSAAIAISLESPEGMQGIMTLLTMPIFFTSNALYPMNAFPPALQAISMVNPLTYLVTGIRYFAIGDNFQAIGIHYTYTPLEIVIAFLFLVGFAGLMFALAWWRFRKAVVT